VAPPNIPSFSDNQRRPRIVCCVRGPIEAMAKVDQSFHLPTPTCALANRQKDKDGHM
jgi:hypothetical protein